MRDCKELKFDRKLSAALREKYIKIKIKFEKPYLLCVCCVFIAFPGFVFQGSFEQNFRPVLESWKYLFSIDHRQPKLAVWVLEYFIDSLNIINEQVEMKNTNKETCKENIAWINFFVEVGVF